MTLTEIVVPQQLRLKPVPFSPDTFSVCVPFSPDTFSVCHACQKDWLDASQGMDSYIQTMRDLTADVGRMSGRFEYAEGWRRRWHWGFCGPDDDPLRKALARYVIDLS